MGQIYADLRLTNMLRGLSMDITALVDTGAVFVCVPEAVAVQLGFDPEECTHKLMTLADGSQKRVARIIPLEVTFGNRVCTAEALVLGDEPLMGVLPIEAMDLVIDPRNQVITVNPAHPNEAVYKAK